MKVSFRDVKWLLNGAQNYDLNLGLWVLHKEYCILQWSSLFFVIIIFSNTDCHNNTHICGSLLLIHIADNRFNKIWNIRVRQKKVVTFSMRRNELKGVLCYDLYLGMLIPRDGGNSICKRGANDLIWIFIKVLLKKWAHGRRNRVMRDVLIHVYCVHLCNVYA